MRETFNVQKVDDPIVSIIVSELKKLRPDQIWLFGSRSRSVPGDEREFKSRDDSDYDLLIAYEDEEEMKTSKNTFSSIIANLENSLGIFIDLVITKIDDDDDNIWRAVRGMQPKDSKPGDVSDDYGDFHKGRLLFKRKQ